MGKTALCAGLGKYLLSDGKKVGFFKPVVADIKSPPAIDSDAAFIKHVFALEEPISHLCPVINDHNTLANRIKEAYARVSPGKDMVIVEGTWRQRPGAKLTEASYEIVEALGARVIIVESYSAQSSRARINSYKEFGEHLLGVVVNMVPRNRLEQIREEISAQFGEAGINVLGVLPEDRTLFALTVAELAQHIQGEILSHEEKSGELVENVMLGAMCVDPGPEYYGRKTNKAVVVRSERPDMQLAALETPTKCLVISGDTPLSHSVLYGADVKSVPIISARSDVNSIVTGIEEALGKAKFNQETKLLRLTEIMEQHFDFQALYKGLGLKAG